MLRRALVLFGALLVVGGGVVLMTTDDHESGPRPAEEESSTPDEPTVRRRAAPTAEPTADDSPETDPLVFPTTCVVRVMGPGAQPIQGAVVVVGPDASTFDGRASSVEVGAIGLTDADGRFETLPPPDGETWFAGTGATMQVVERLESETTLRVARALPFSMTVVDAETGVEIPTSVAVGRTDFFLEGIEWTTLPREGSTTLWPATPAEPGGELRVSVLPEAPAGYVAATPQRVFDEISVLARELCATMVLRRPLDLRVRVLDHTGQPAEDATITRVRLGGSTPRYDADFTDSDGWARIRGVPFARRQRLVVTASWDWRSAKSEPVRLVESGDPIEVVVTIPDPDDVPFEGPGHGGVIGIGGSGGSEKEPVRDEDRAKLTLSLVASDGSQPANVEVRVQPSEGGKRRTARTDDSGEVDFAGLAPGTYNVVAVDPGMIPASATVALLPGERLSSVLHEPAGRPLNVRVVDKDGNPWPLARIHFGVEVFGERIGLARVVDGVQDVRLRVGADGCLTIPNAPPGVVFVNAFDWATQAWVESDERDVEVVLGKDD